MDFDNIENLNEEQIMYLYNDIVEGADEGAEFLARCYTGNGCCGGWVCYMYCVNGEQKQGVSGPVRCK